MVAFLEASEFFGEGCLAGQSLRMATVTAMVELRDHARGQGGLCPRDPSRTGLFRDVHGPSPGRTIRVEADLVDQLFNSSEKRLARLLLLLANFGKEGKPEPMLAKISQETLAEMIGTTRSRVSFFMNKFRKLGLIEYNGRTHRSPQFPVERRPA